MEHHVNNKISHSCELQQILCEMFFVCFLLLNLYDGLLRKRDN